jgi:hypothetical protein
MKAKDFTEEFVFPKLSDYVTNQNFPDDLYDIGSKVYIEDVNNVEIKSVTRTTDGNFEVSGKATVETSTDTGEGASFDGSYPLTFTLDFNDEGEIEKGRVKVDTSSFYK